ncbi:CaiB/BaiF CoA-transferase family protein [Planococcus shenhongbingii]|uniref:CaiB/BaiF CoA transferase family protein n=1 Tax=Planococcus shenhongbingii TaxID=3058398 RepID=UPI00262168B3|nr:CaiB/BaiF CoA-transferase family protein [Planococcus sp. N016]WKA58318.1 CaiB/BaiF CoA-transferase family protein [Planococcus sp. N016]
MTKPLEGVKVLELGSLIAGPFAARIMGEFGAEVIKVEPPGKGDPIRNWRVVHEGTSLWWYVQSRNKKCITLDLKSLEGKEIIQKLAEEVDIVVENFRPGTLEKWGIGYEDLKKVNKKIIFVRISGYGQDGPYKDKPGFGSIGEAVGGIRHLTGYPELPPTRVGISLGDSVASLYGVIGALMALRHRDISGEGQIVDVALYEAVFSLMESMVPEYDHSKIIRERTGSTLPGITPSNIYLCKDGKYVVIGANGDSIFKRLCKCMDREDLSADERFQTNEGRSNYAEYLDGEIMKWTSQHDLKEILIKLDDYSIPSGPIYNVADMMADPHFLARKMIEEVEVEGIGKLKFPGIIPKLSLTPGTTEWSGPALGKHNMEIYKDLVGLSEERIKSLKEQGKI